MGNGPWGGSSCMTGVALPGKGLGGASQPTSWRNPPPSMGVLPGCGDSGCWQPQQLPPAASSWPGTSTLQRAAAFTASGAHVPRATGKPGPARAVPGIAEGVVEPAWLPAAPPASGRGAVVAQCGASAPGDLWGRDAGSAQLPHRVLGHGRLSRGGPS